MLSESKFDGSINSASINSGFINATAPVRNMCCPPYHRAEYDYTEIKEKCCGDKEKCCDGAMDSDYINVATSADTDNDITRYGYTMSDVVKDS